MVMSASNKSVVEEVTVGWVPTGSKVSAGFYSTSLIWYFVKAAFVGSLNFKRIVSTSPESRGPRGYLGKVSS